MAAYQRLGRYELVGHLATGGMAEIHLARSVGEHDLAHTVVVKRLLPELVAAREYVAMFLDEGKLVARLAHPNICEVFEAGHDGADYFLAMPYLDGVPVHELIARPRDPDRLAEARVGAGIVVQACAGLHHAHELRDADGALAGLVHRDVSPSNLMLTSTGVVKVLDFGIAKVRGATETELGQIKGKQQYMAPEQLLGEPLDRRCDVFALGIVLFELVTHQRLFKRASDYLTARAVLEDPIPRADIVDPALPATLADVIAKALSRRREDRYATVADFAQAIEGAMRPQGGVASEAELAAVVLGTDELSATRTRQAQVLARAQHQLTDVTTIDAPPRRIASWIPFAVVGVLVLGGVGYVATRGTSDATPRAAASGATTNGSGVIATTPRGESASTSDAGTTGVVRVVDAPASDVDPVSDAAADVARVVDAPPAEPVVRPAKPRDGTFSIDSTPYATIYVDGTKLGVTPIVKRSLAAGRHTVRAVLADGRSKQWSITVPAGRGAPPVQLTW